MADPGMVLLAPPPAFLLADPQEPGIEISQAAGGPEAFYAFHTGTITTQVLLLPGAMPQAPLAALVILDREWRGRIEVLMRFGLSWKERRPPPDSRLTPQQRRRLRLEIQAVDGRASGASYREIAIAMFGRARVADEPWKTHPLKRLVKGLVAGGAAKIDRGYLRLLRYSHRY